jgi:hypothetical protein
MKASLKAMEERLIASILDNKQTVFDQQEGIRKSLDEMAQMLKGDTATPGLLTIVCLNKQAIKRAWWWLASLSLALLGWLGWLIRGKS